MTTNEMVELAKSHRGFIFWNAGMNRTPKQFADLLPTNIRHFGTDYGLTEKTIVQRAELALGPIYQQGDCLFHYGMPTLPALEELASMVSNESHEFFESVVDRGDSFRVVLDVSFFKTLTAVRDNQSLCIFAENISHEALAARFEKAASKFVQIECVDQGRGKFRLRSMPA